MAAWPNIGKLLLDGLQEEPDSALLRTSMEDGPPKQIQTKSRVMTTLAVTYLFSATEMDTFLTFFNTTLKRGGDWFTWTRPRDGASMTVRIRNGQIRAVPLAAPGEALQHQVSFALEWWG